MNLAIVLGLDALGLGREFGGDCRGYRTLYGGTAGIVVALAITGIFALIARRQ